MLVLTRRKDESLIIGDDIVITILGIEGDKVKIGIAAPQEVPILREEVYKAMIAQNKIKERLEQGPEPEAFKELRRMLSEEESTPPKED